ncbi:MAG: outer membrane beta-barrel protein, partial [Chitinophagaceae bacterium]|nr:outer membrane beta-barrel protein [Chitinophagaceae bacterium]
MRKFITVIFLLTSCQISLSQFSLGIFGGASNYQGDLVDGIYKQTKLAIGVTGNYSITERFTLRAGLTFAKVAGADSVGTTEFLRQIRNLSFESNITEFSLLGELTIFNLGNIRWSPYVFGGLAVYHFNPYAIDSNQKVYLQPLSTEGQGLSQYPDRKPYSLNQLAIPIGGGVSYVVSDNIRVGVEVGLRKLFTDY